MIPDWLRVLVSHPLFLRMLVEGYNGNEIPNTTTETELINQYIRLKISGRGNQKKRHVLDAIADNMYDSRSNALNLSNLNVEPHIHREIENFEKSSAYVELLDDGILTEISQEPHPFIFEDYVRFTFDRVFDFMMANRFLYSEKVINGDSVISYIKEAALLPDLLGSAEIVVEKLISANPSSLSFLIDNIQDQPKLTDILLRILLRYAETRPKELLHLLELQIDTTATRKKVFQGLLAEMFRKGFNTNLYNIFHEISKKLTIILEDGGKKLAMIFFGKARCIRNRAPFLLRAAV